MVGIDFVADDEGASPLAEWMARVSPWLPADDPHQRCIADARDRGLLSVECSCPKPDRCLGPCCNPTEEW